MDAISLGFVGIIRAQKHDAITGELISDNNYFNTDTYFLRSTVANWLCGTKTTSTVPPPTQIGAGTGIGTPSASDTALWSPISGTQRVCDSISTAQGYYAQYDLTYQTTDPNGAYTEVGLFDANNNLWAHASINEIKSSGQTLTIQWMVGSIADTSNSAVVVTNYSLATLTGWLAGTLTTTSNPPPTQIQLGTGANQNGVQSTDSSLWTPTSGTLKTCSGIYTSATYNVQYTVTYTASDPSNVYTECGLFDTNGNLWQHASLTNASKLDSRILAVLFQIAVSGD